MITDSYAIALTLLIMARTPVMKQDEPWQFPSYLRVAQLEGFALNWLVVEPPKLETYPSINGEKIIPGMTV